MSLAQAGSVCLFLLSPLLASLFLCAEQSRLEREESGRTLLVSLLSARFPLEKCGERGDGGGGDFVGWRPRTSSDTLAPGGAKAGRTLPPTANQRGCRKTLNATCLSSFTTPRSVSLKLPLLEVFYPGEAVGLQCLLDRNTTRDSLHK